MPRHDDARSDSTPDLVIAEVLCTPGSGGFFCDDQIAIRHGAVRDGFGYRGAPETPGFTSIRQPSTAIAVLLVLSDGQVAHGDCVSVQYPGAGGRDPVFTSAEAVAEIEAVVRPLLVGAVLTGFRELAEEVDGLVVDGRRLHSAVRYGVTQALLDAVARARRVTMAEVVRDEYATQSPLGIIAMFAQCGDERYDNVDKMILHRVAALPHGLINNAATKVGVRGEILADYVRWVRDRVIALRADEHYQPLLHFDCYGTIGEVFANDTDAIADFLSDLAAIATPLRLRIEHPLDAGSRDAQIAQMAQLRRELARRGLGVELVVDEWCNTLEDIAAFVAAGAADVIHVKVPDLGGINNAIEALLLVRAHGLKAYCGGSCTETERSAQVSAHLAMACDADQILAKPGMGVDEGVQIVGNEMARIVTLVASRSTRRR